MTLAPEINTLLMKHDIEGLIEAGAPLDEYQDEASQLSAALEKLPRRSIHEELVVSLLALVWAKSFELDQEAIRLRSGAFQTAARDILAAHQSNA